MDEIIIGFSRPKSGFEPFSWLIRLITWAPMSHAYIRYYNTYAGRWVIFQASGMKVNFIGQEMFDSKELICGEFNIPVSTETKQSVIQKAIDQCGSPYGIGQVIGFGWVLLMKLFGKNIQNPFYSGSSFFCSEITADELEDMGLKGLDPQIMSPKDLYDYMINNGFKQIGE